MEVEKEKIRSQCEEIVKVLYVERTESTKECVYICLVGRAARAIYASLFVGGVGCV